MLLTKFQKALAAKFSLKNLGAPTHFLGIEIVPTQSGLFLTQHHYIRDLLHSNNMHEAKPVTTPQATTCDLATTGDASTCDITIYRKLVGSLQYLSLTIPDIAFSVNKLSQYMQAPTGLHMQVAKRILRYLKGTIDFGLHLRKSNSLQLHAFCDLDWAGDSRDMKSTGAYIVYLGSNPISWSCKKQTTVPKSSTKA
uniref:Reverse transcriptase Ty1/copia-type domain-containing protein n=1 Tax=Cajanus cajan TaxID=3821 RepID=A0A151TVK9_CAJCA|nr:hypothetical protein KK1_010318 [Cajanus cajan]